jgi:hypothetical protein
MKAIPAPRFDVPEDEALTRVRAFAERISNPGVS